MRFNWKREHSVWVALLVVAGIIYIGGWHTLLIGKLQQAVLATGIIAPHVVEDQQDASYAFALETLEGEKVPFEKMKHQVVFLNFWASWCPPCIAEMPDIQSLYESKKDDVTFAMISLDKDRAKARKFIDEKNYEFPVYFLSGGLPSSYQISSIPTTYVLSRQGKIVVEKHGMAKYNSKKFKALLTQLSEAE